MAWTIKIIGCTELISGENPLYTTLQSATGFSEVSYQVYGGNPEFKIDKERDDRDLDGYDPGVKDFRVSFKFKLKAKSFPTSAITVENFYSWSAPLAKKYKYIYSTDYPFLKTYSALGKALAVSLKGFSFEHDEELGRKVVTLDFVARYPL
jgi:hypothetical protein